MYALACRLGLSDLQRLPAQPCLASRVETGIAIAAADLAFIDAVETRLAAEFGGDAVVRCRVTHGGVVIEVGEANETAVADVARAIGADACRTDGRVFVGVRAYRRGAAFLHVVANG